MCQFVPFCSSFDVFLKKNFFGFLYRRRQKSYRLPVMLGHQGEEPVYSADRQVSSVYHRARCLKTRYSRSNSVNNRRGIMTLVLEGMMGMMTGEMVGGEAAALE